MSDNLHADLLEALRKGIPGVKLLADKHKTDPYVIVKYNDKTIGYVNGRRKLRIQSPRRERQFLLTHPIQIRDAVAFIRSNIGAAS